MEIEPVTAGVTQHAQTHTIVIFTRSSQNFFSDDSIDQEFCLGASISATSEYIFVSI